jgi:hypothetical protein
VHAYSQSNGNWSHGGELWGTGYSGHGVGLNNPQMESVHNVGPIPKGQWTISQTFTHPKLGEVVMRLEPCGGTETYGRSSFFCHGDSIEFPGMEEASHGCIVLGRPLRELIAASSDKDLEVV